MSTFALIHGGGGTSWDWHLVSSELREHGHDPVAVDLPSEDDAAGWSEYAYTFVQAVAIAATSSPSGTRSAASRRRSSARASPPSCLSSSRQ